MWNAIAHIKKLESVGIPRKQAEAYVEIVSEIRESTLATKEDIKRLEMIFDKLERIIREVGRHK